MIIVVSSLVDHVRDEPDHQREARERWQSGVQGRGVPYPPLRVIDCIYDRVVDAVRREMAR